MTTPPMRAGIEVLAIQRVCTMNHQSRLDSVLARYFGIQRGHEFTDRHCRAAAASRDG